jgi:NAD+ synthase (glutamine-hydrolysing)
VQAGERTSHLFRLANHQHGLVVGTGDLSELALGWSTYGVGDHMSHYNVNVSVPKTLIQYLIGWVAKSGQFNETVSRALARVLGTEISPELKPNQKTEDVIGPYELQDFHLYYTLRFGYAPAKVAFLAWHAWKDEYSLGEIRQWLEVFLQRFFPRPASSSAAPCPTARRSARAARSRRAATGARPRTATRRAGWTT